MNVDVTYLPNEAEYPTAEAAREHVAAAMAARKAQLEAP